MNIDAAETKVVISEVMMPNKANIAGNVHGGEIMKLMDSSAYAAARRYARSNVVTARVDELEFHLPILIGDLVICSAEVVFVGRSSLEVAVTVEVEDLDHYGKRQKALSAYFTMVALDERSKPRTLPQLVLDTTEAQEKFAEGKRRYEEHKAKKRKEREQREQQN
ncbi:acyl-CoA thioesterase [Anaerosinus massiliensis]|uniref:acyl-CoA thioesterase n=1 Tax=Massilibacillus massiliensis TaxID=1806837 RepID=UPI000A9860C0|nr:acyl-CoA thioesterase [Massilibacillus massiliensis]